MEKYFIIIENNMVFDKRQFQLKAELEDRLEWYWQIRDKTAKQLVFAPKSTKGLMTDLMFLIDQKAIPIVKKLLDSIGRWSREDAQSFYQINQDVCRIADLINYDASDEDRQTWQNPNLDFLK